MSPPAPPCCNQTVDGLPESLAADSCFVYRESPWIALPIRAALTAIAIGLGVMVVRALSDESSGFNSLFIASAGALIFAASLLRRDDSINFICARAGLYFPEASRLTRRPGRWLFVPWKNILEYRVQRMLDETSSRGIVLVIQAPRDEVKNFLSGHRVLNLSALRDHHADHAVRIGFSTFLPGPDEVLRQLRTYEAMPSGDHGPTPLTINSAA